MATGQQNPREQLDQALATVKRLLRYWWIVLIFVSTGTGLAIAFAMTRPRSYESSTVIMHRDVIPTDLLANGRAQSSSRYMRARFREMLMARPLLEKVIVESGMFEARIKKKGMAMTVASLRSQIVFRGKGGGTFHITFRGSTPEMAQEVTASLARQLIEWELRLQLESVNLTKSFLDREAKRLGADLVKAEQEFARFLAEHPEFADETLVMSGAAGASIRARNPTPTVGVRQPKRPRTRLFALERQRVRLNARLNRSANSKPVTRKSPPTKAERMAEQAVGQAQREVDREKRRLENLRLKFTDLHPDVQAAQRRVTRANGLLRLAQSRLATAKQGRPKPVVIVKAVSAGERAKIRLDIRRLDIAIMNERKRLAAGGKPKPAPESPSTSGVVALETQWSQLFRNVRDMKERSASIESKAFTADIMASSAIARQGVQLTVVDPAELPTQPAGMGRKLIVMAGFFLSGMLGLGLAFGIVMMDDRIFHRRDIDRLEIAPVLTVIPATKHKKDKKKRHG